MCAEEQFLRGVMKRPVIFLILAAVSVAVVLALRGSQSEVSELDDLLRRLEVWGRDRPVAFALTFFAAYVAVAALALPLAAFSTVCAGALFGFWPGLLIASFASTTGATLAFTATRLLLRDWVTSKLRDRAGAIEAGLTRDGAFYLFSLRLMPVVPFSVVNLVMGLTAMRTRTFFLVSLVGMLPGTAVYVNAGTQLASVHSLVDILSLPLLLSFALLGLLPWIVRFVLIRVARHRRECVAMSLPRIPVEPRND